MSRQPLSYVRSYVPHTVAAIELQFNSFTGTIPTEFGLLTDLGELRVPDCAVPTCVSHRVIGAVYFVVHLRLDVNQFTGNYSCASSVDLCLISCTDTSNEACRSL